MLPNSSMGPTPIDVLCQVYGFKKALGGSPLEVGLPQHFLSDELRRALRPPDPPEHLWGPKKCFFQIQVLFSFKSAQKQERMNQKLQKVREAADAKLQVVLDLEREQRSEQCMRWNST